MLVGRVAALDALEQEWAALADRVAAPPSLHPGYVRAWLESYAEPERLIAGAVYEEGELVAVAPLVRAGGGRLTGMRQAEEWGVVATDPAAARAAVTTALSRTRVGAAIRPVPADEDAMHALHGAAHGLALMSRVYETQPLVEITTDWDTYFAGVPQKRNLKRARNRLEELGPVEVRTNRDAEGLEAAFAEMLRIEASGWKGREGTALAQDPRGTGFYERLARWAAAQGMLRLELLTAGGTAVAFAFDLVAHGVRYSLKIGYDEAHARSSPGRVLLAEQIRAAFAEGLRRFDFAGGGADFKATWANAERRYAQVALFPRGPAGRTAEAATRAAWWARPIAKRLRDRVRDGGGA